MTDTSTIEEIDHQTLIALIARVEEAIEHDLALSVEDMKLLLLAISTLCTLQQKIEENDVTLHKLRKLLGMVRQSEQRRKHNTNDKESKTPDKKKKQLQRQKKSTSKRKPPRVVHHKIIDYARGQVCPACYRGKLYKYEPGKLLRITGHARFEAVQHIIEQLRCNACQEVYKAPLPEDVLEDGTSDQMYGYSARSLMVIDKCFSGQPYYHQSTLADIFGHSISASTIFDQCEYVANDAMPVFYELKRQAADAKQFLLDDTPHRILEQDPEWRDKPNGKGKVLRTGVYSSGLIAELNDGHEIVLFETSLGHAGEHLNGILKNRTPGLSPPLTMSDALSSNHVTQCEVKKAYCNAHARRQFVDIEHLYPKDVEWVLNTYALIWEADDAAKEKSMNNQERLAYHKEQSLPAMEKIKTWAEEKQASEDFEEHGGLGKAIKYFLKHYDHLILFCIEPGALIDNNRMEEKLKIIIRGRKTAHFYKTAVGADVANVLISLIATAYGARENIYEYLTTLQKNKEYVKASPADWLPWTYRNTIERVVEESKILTISC